MNVRQTCGRGALVILAILLVPAAAWPQIAVPPLQEDESQAAFRLRGVALTPTVALTSLGVDTNVFNAVEAPERDFTMTLSPGVDAWARAGRIRLAARGRTDLVYFHRHASERSIDGGIAVRLAVPLNRLIPWVEGGRYSGRQRAGYEIDLRSRRAVETSGLGVEYRLRSRGRLRVGLHRERTSWDGDALYFGNSLKEHLDRSTRSLDVAYRQELTVLTTLVVEASAVRERFDHSMHRDTHGIRTIAGFDLKPRALIDGSVRVGYRTFQPVTGVFQPFRGLVARADIGYVFRDATRLSFEAERDTHYSYERDYPYYVQAGASATITQRFGDAWDAQARAGRRRLGYRRDASAPAGPIRGDTVEQLAGGIAYRVGRAVRLGFTIDRYRRRSPAQGRDYEGYRIGGAITYGR